MKRTLLALICLLSIGQTQAQTLIHYWNFNKFVSPVPAAANPSTFAPIKADYSVIDTNKAEIDYKFKFGSSATYSTYYDTVTGDTINARLAATAGEALRLRNPSDSMEALFYVPSTGYKNLVFSFETEASSATNGSKNQVFTYSVDSGTTWKNTGMTITSITGTSSTQDSVLPAWALVTVAFDSTVNNKGGFVIKMTFTGTDTTAKGNDRFDNVTLDGKSISGVGVANIASNVATPVLYPNPAGNNVYINTFTDGQKEVLVYDVTGKKVYSATADERTLRINAEGLVNGMYFVNVRTADGNIYNMKFVKQ